MEERTNNFSIEKSRNGLSVPVINGVYLHSIYNPSKEAEVFAQENEEILSRKNHVMVLGLGFGYHIEKIAKTLSENHSEYKIVIIETNQKLIEEFISTRNFEDKNIKIYHLKSPEQLYSIEDYVAFLMKKPAVLKHETSFSLSRDQFHEMLSFKASQSEKCFNDIISPNTKKLFRFDNRNELEMRWTELKSPRATLRQEDFLAIAFNSLRK